MALLDARLDKQVNKKTGRLAYHYTCAKCKKAFVNTDVQVDHIKPVVDPKRGFVSWDEFIERLYCEKENLQVLCKPCHKKKTLSERKARTNGRV